MKAHSLKLATVAVALCAFAVLLLVPDLASAATLFVPDLSHAGGWHVEAAQLATALAVLRTQHADLIKRAESKEGEIREGMAEAELTRIKGEHAALVAEAETVQRQIADAEAAERGRLATPAGVHEQINAAVTAALGAERTRATTLRDIGTRAGLPDADVLTAINDPTVTVEAFRTQAFDALVLRRGAPTSSVSVQPGQLDEVETRRAAMGEAIAFRMSQASQDKVAPIKEPTERARQWVGMGIVEMAAEAIGHRGHLRTAAQVDGVMKRAFMSTSDFPGIFGNAINARLLARYLQATPTYRMFCARYNAVDFRAMNIIRAGDFPRLQAVPETGVIRSGTFSESKETMQVYPYGVTFNLSRAMFINDNLGAIEQILGSAGDSVMDWENAQAFTRLRSGSGNLGPTLATDGYQVFDSTNHGNYTSSGTAISPTSVGIGRAAMMKQTSLDGLKLNLQPAVLLTGPDPATVADQLLTQITPASIANAVPDWQRRLSPAADANLSGNGWYLFADVNKAPCFVYGTLDGSQGPRLTTDDPFTIQGLSVKLEHDFGTAATDYRGGYYNAGA